MSWSDLSSRREAGWVSRSLSWSLLLLPVVTLVWLGWHYDSPGLAVAAALVSLFALGYGRGQPVWRPPVGVYLVATYLIAALWTAVALREVADALPHVLEGLLLAVGVILLAVYDLNRTGAEPLRRANRLARRIAARTSWPEQLADYRELPEVVALRQAIAEEPAPALALLADPRPEVQTAALAALEYRPQWRPGEAEWVLQVARRSREPAVRLAAVYALAGVRTAELIAGLADFLRDPSQEVRQATAEALLWDLESRWPFAREAVREALADPRFADDGPLFAGCGRLPAAAVADLVTWSDEPAPLARRAVLTVIDHYHTELLAGDRPELGPELAAMMLDDATSPALRVELAALLRDHQLLTPDLLDRLTNLNQPAPIRLFAAEVLLRINPHDPDGIDVLRGLARQPNRELAVQVGAVLQNVLGLDMGLPDSDLPAPTSRSAVEVARRVMAWASGTSSDVLWSASEPPPAPVSRGSLPSVPPLSSSPTDRPAERPAGLLDDSLLVSPGSSSRSSDDSLLIPPVGSGGPSLSRSSDDSLLIPPVGSGGPSSSRSSDDSLLIPPVPPPPEAVPPGQSPPARRKPAAPPPPPDSSAIF